jgi:hypothetical protein
MPVDEPEVGNPIFNPLNNIENAFEGFMNPPDAIESLWNCKHDVQGAEMLTGMESRLV